MFPVERFTGSACVVDGLIDRVADAGLTDSHLLVLDLPRYLDTTHVTEPLSDA